MRSEKGKKEEEEEEDYHQLSVSKTFVCDCTHFSWSLAEKWRIKIFIIALDWLAG